MKKFYIPYIVFCFVVLTLIIFPYKNISKPIIEEKTQKTYTVKAKNNKILLFNNENKIIKELDIDYDSLRSFDKEQLNKGIKIADHKELNQFIEDFSN